MEKLKIYTEPAGIRKTRAPQGLGSFPVDSQKIGGQANLAACPNAQHIGDELVRFVKG